MAIVSPSQWLRSHGNHAVSLGVRRLQEYLQFCLHMLFPMIMIQYLAGTAFADLTQVHTPDEKPSAWEDPEVRQIPKTPIAAK